MRRSRHILPGRKQGADPGKAGDIISLSASLVKLEEVAGEKEVSASLFRWLPHNPDPDKQQKMNGWMESSCTLDSGGIKMISKRMAA